MKLSCCTLAYIVTTPLEEAIRRIAEAGFKGVDLYTGPPHIYPPHYSDEDRKVVRTLIDELGLELTGFAVAGGILNLGLNFSSPNPKIREDTLQYYKDNINLAADIGCPLINVLTGHCLCGTTREQGRQWTMDAFRELVPLAEEKGVIFGLHPQYIGDSPLMVTIDDALDIIKELGSKMVKIIFDTAQQNITFRNFSEDIKKIGSNLCYIHAADNDGVSWTHMSLGKGTVNWEGLVTALKRIDYDGTICVQAWSGEPMDSDAMIRDSKEYLDNILRKVG